MTRRYGNIQVFDNADAERLAMHWQPADLADQEHAFFDPHLRAQITRLAPLGVHDWHRIALCRRPSRPATRPGLRGSPRDKLPV